MRACCVCSAAPSLYFLFCVQSGDVSRTLGPTVALVFVVGVALVLCFFVIAFIRICNWMRVDEGRKGRSFLAIKSKARAVVGRGARRACLVTLDLIYVYGEGERKSSKIIHGMSK